MIKAKEFRLLKDRILRRRYHERVASRVGNFLALGLYEFAVREHCFNPSVDESGLAAALAAFRQFGRRALPKGFLFDDEGSEALK